MEIIKEFGNIDSRAFWLLWYVFPTIVCLVFVTSKSIRDYNKDLRERQAAENKEEITGYAWYTPKLTVGKLIWRYVQSHIPVVNVYLLITAVLPFVIRLAARLFGDLFDIPLVPAHKRPNEKDEVNKL